MRLWIFTRDMCSACIEVHGKNYGLETIEFDMTPDSVSKEAYAAAAWAECIGDPLPVIVLWGEDMRQPVGKWTGFAPEESDVKKLYELWESENGRDHA